MAIYHFSVKTFSKMTSACAIAKAAYRSGEKLHDDMQDRIYDYQHRENVLYSNIQIPDNCPEAYKDRETLWNAVESQKSNINSRFAREFEIALPNEWDIGKAKDYLNDFVKEQFIGHLQIVSNTGASQSPDELPQSSFTTGRHKVSNMGALPCNDARTI